MGEELAESFQVSDHLRLMEIKTCTVMNITVPKKQNKSLAVKVRNENQQLSFIRQTWPEELANDGFFLE